MIIYCANDEYGENLILAKSIKSLISYLIELDVFNDDTDILIIKEENNDCEWTTLKKFYGDCWKNTITNLTIDELNDLFFNMDIIFFCKESP